MRSALVCALILALPVATFAADPKPDFTLTVEAFAKEAKANGKAFRAKYKNKVVELSGAVWNPRVPQGDVMLTGTDAKVAEIDKIVSVSPPKFKLEQRHRALARGQKVTVRGKQADAAYPALIDCEFVTVGPSTAIPVTVPGLAAEFTADAAMADKKYEGRSVVLRAKVLAAKAEKDKVRWTLTAPDGKGDAKIEVLADPLFGDPLKKLQQVKAGDVIVLIGDVSSLYGTPCELRYPLVLDEPPAGVKLPGDKK